MENPKVIKWSSNEEGGGGKKSDLPYELRKLIYDEYIKIDFKEHSNYIKKLHDEGKEGYAAGWETDIQGLSFIIGSPDKEIIVLMNVLDQDTGKMKVMALKFLYGKERTLIPEYPMWPEGPEIVEEGNVQT